MTDNSIFIEAANAIVRQGILFRQTELLKLIQEEFPHVKRLEITINPGF